MTENMKKVKIFDTTLRDGEQSPGCSMNLREKLEMAIQLEKLGVDVIEAGFAIASPEDFQSVKEIAAVLEKTTVASLARAKKMDIDAAYDAVKGAKKPRIHVFLASSDIHLQHKLKITREQMLAKVKEMVAYAKSLIDDIQFSAEDASRSDWDFLVEVYSIAIESGATVINVPDTVGYVTPQEMYDLVTYLRKNIRGMAKAEMAVHCHNDLGMAVANTLASIKAGVEQVECTINGIGERAGNAALEEIVMALYTKKDFYNVTCNIDTTQIYKTSRQLSFATGVPIPAAKAVVGANAFGHVSGIQQHGVMNERLTYEIMCPETIGIPQNKMVLGKHSGKHAFEDKLKTLGYALEPETLSEVFASFKKLADLKKTVSDRDIEALLANIPKKEVEEIYKLESFVVSSSSNNSSTAMVKLSIKNENVMDTVKGVGVGAGPIDAAFSAIDTIVKKAYTLENFSIQAVTEGEDALGEVIVRLKNKDGAMVSGRGLNLDIIAASLEAYINAMNKMEAHIY